MSKIPSIAHEIFDWARRRSRALAFVCTGLLLTAVAPPAAMPQGAAFDLPEPGDARERPLSPGESHTWQLALAFPEYLQVDVEPLGLGESDEWPLLTVAAPDGGTVYESTEPTLVPSIDSRAYFAMSFVGDRSGSYRLTVAARRSPLRYRLHVTTRRPAVDADEQRLAAHALWRDATKLVLQATPESFRASMAKLNEALAILTGIEDAEGEALTLGAISAVWYRLSDAAQGRPATSRALEIWTRLGRQREEGIALSDLGLLAYLAYDRASARSFYDRALPKHRAAGDVLSEARTLTRLGWVQYAAAQLQEVVDTNLKALELYRRIAETGGESIAFNDLGRAYIDLGEVAQALEAFRRAIALRPPDRDARGAANVLIRMALVYLNVGEWQQALDALRQARELAQRAHDVRIESTALINLGSAYVTLGDTTEGFRHLEPALELARSIEFRGAEAYALLWMGIGASLDGGLARTRDYLQQAIAIQVAIKDVRGEATTQRALASAHLALGSPQDALSAINRSAEISPAASGLVYSSALALANVHAALGDDSKATAHYEEAVQRFREIRARHAEALALAQFARFQARRGLLAMARGLLDQALAIHESLRGLIVDPDLRMSYSSTTVAPYRLQIDVLMALERRSPGGGFAAAAFNTHERARARGLLEMLVTSGVDLRRGVDAALLERERTLRWKLNAKAGIQMRLLAGKPDPRRLATLEQEITALSREWRETTTSIRQLSPGYASLTEPTPATASEISGHLGAETVLLEFAPGETGSWLFVVTDKGLESFELPAWRVIDEAARTVHRLMTSRQPVRGEPAARRQARIRRADARLAERMRALSDLVLGPVATRLAGEWRGRRLAIVASGALEYVPFAALPAPGRSSRASSPLIASHEIITLPSASTLVLLRQQRSRRPAARRMIAVLADPVFAPDDPRVRRAAEARASPTGGATTASPAAAAAQARNTNATRAFEPFLDVTRGTLARLPFSRAEASAVAAQVPRASLLHATDFDATLALATSGRLDGYRIVHFATHGLINTLRPELSGLALSMVDPSGRSRDGFLRLNTIYNMRLSSDLVVLSACQSALGKEIAGEGLVGLTRGFMYAGARGVIASLWQVNDAATAELMKRFYASLLQRRLPAAAALRAAQLEISKEPQWASPYYWAGFVLQGDWKQQAISLPRFAVHHPPARQPATAESDN